MTTKIKMLCAEFAEWIIRQEQWQEDRGDALSLPADEQENGHKPPELPVVGEQQDTTQIRINHLTFADCERLAGEGCLVFANAWISPTLDFKPVNRGHFKKGYYHEFYVLLYDDIISLRRNTPEKLEYGGGALGWTGFSHGKCWRTDKGILEDWRAGHYRLKAETQETKQETEQ